MSENLIAYWENWNESEYAIPITKDGYIFKYMIANEQSNDSDYEWVCCKSKKKLYAFIKYFILPSLQLSRTIGVKENTICLEVLNYDETLDYLDNPKFIDYKEHLAAYQRWFAEIEKLEQEDAPFRKLKDYIDRVCSEIDFTKLIYVELELYENICSVGREMVEEWDKYDSLDTLELYMKMNKEEIIDFFDNIGDNKFMLATIPQLLGNRNI